MEESRWLDTFNLEEYTGECTTLENCKMCKCILKFDWKCVGLRERKACKFGKLKTCKFGKLKKWTVWNEKLHVQLWSQKV